MKIAFLFEKDNPFIVGSFLIEIANGSIQITKRYGERGASLANSTLNSEKQSDQS